MNAIILTAIWGVIMMFSGVFVKSKTTPRFVAITGMTVVLASSIIELLTKKAFFNFDHNSMLHTDGFNLTFIAIVMTCSLIYFLLTGTEIEKVGAHVGEYFALIFFILCGISIAATFNTLLMLFIGIEIISIPLYILTGSDKRKVKGNEAALK